MERDEAQAEAGQEPRSPQPILPESPVRVEMQHLMESPLMPRVQQWLEECGTLQLTPEDCTRLSADGVTLLGALEHEADAQTLRDIVRCTQMFLLSRHGADAIYGEQGTWRSLLADLEAQGGWRGSLAAWNTGKLESQLAGRLEHQLEHLRQSLDAFLRAAQHGEQQLPMAMPVTGAEIDASHLQSPEQRGTVMTNVLPPPHRLIPALAVTVAYDEKQLGNSEETERLLTLADRHRSEALQTFASAPLLRLNLLLNQLIAQTTVRQQGETHHIDDFIRSLDAEQSVPVHKRTEWLAHAYGLLAIETGDEADLRMAVDQLRTIARQRPQSMTIIAIEPTFKELEKHFPQISDEVQPLIALAKKGA